MYLEQKVAVMTWMVFFYHTNQTFKDDSYSTPTKKKMHWLSKLWNVFIGKHARVTTVSGHDPV